MFRIKYEVRIYSSLIVEEEEEEEEEGRKKGRYFVKPTIVKNS